jgi:hypothetical protein
MLADDIAWALPSLRAEAEANMASICTIRKNDTRPTTDPETGEVTPGVGTLVYSGKCRIQPGATQSQSQSRGGAETFEFAFIVSVPFSATGIRAGHLVTIDGSPDPDAVGLLLEVQPTRFAGDNITARRFGCNEVA